MGQRKLVICNNSLVTVKYTGNTTNIYSNFNDHHPDLGLERTANAKVVVQPAAISTMFKAKFVFIPMRVHH